jgi:hypothetical protein
MESKRKRLMLGKFRIIEDEHGDMLLYRDTGLTTEVYKTGSLKEAYTKADEVYRECARKLLKYVRYIRNDHG